MKTTRLKIGALIAGAFLMPNMAVAGTGVVFGYAAQVETLSSPAGGDTLVVQKSVVTKDEIVTIDAVKKYSLTTYQAVTPYMLDTERRQVLFLVNGKFEAVSLETVFSNLKK